MRPRAPEAEGAPWTVDVTCPWCENPISLALEGAVDRWAKKRPIKCMMDGQQDLHLVGKDRPSDASEFSHPDVLIGLTTLAVRHEGRSVYNWSRVSGWFTQNARTRAQLSRAQRPGEADAPRGGGGVGDT